LVSVAALALVSGALTGTAGAMDYGDDDWAQVVALDCVSSTQCTALGIPYTYSRRGAVVPASPDRTLAATFNPKDPDGKLRGSSIASSDQVENIVCASGTRCVAFDVAGRKWPDYRTVGISFNPRSAARVQRFPLGSGRFALASCPTSSQCTATLRRFGSDPASHSGTAVTFDPAAGTVSESSQFPAFCRFPGGCPSSEVLTAIDCPSATQCTAAGQERVITFNPRTGSATAAGTKTFENDLYGRMGPTGVDCVSTTQCTVLGRISVCQEPGVTQQNCANSQGQSGVVTFDPTTGAMKSNGIRPIAGTQSGAGPLACPAARKCVTTVSDGAEITFDPLTGGGEKHDLLGKSPGQLTCASESMCLTAVDIYSRGDQASSHIVAFDPDSGKVRSHTPISLDATVEEAEANRRAALRRCRTIDDRSRRAACVSAANKRWG
jgi:hypothetical protein